MSDRPVRASGATVPLGVAVALGAALVATPPARAADDIRFEITPYYGYRLGGDLNDVTITGVSGLEIMDASAYGVILSFHVRPDAQIELQYSQQQTELRGKGSFFPTSDSKLFDVNVENWQLGGRYTGGHPRDPARGFVGFSLGVTNLEPQDSLYDGNAEFSFSFYGGARIRLSDHVGLRLQGQWIVTYLSSHDEVFCDPFGFCYTVSQADYLNQFEIGAGIAFGF